MKKLKYLSVAIAIFMIPSQMVFAITDNAITSSMVTKSIPSLATPLSMIQLMKTTPQISEKESYGIDGVIDEGVSLDIRKDAQKNASLSYGARGGLAFRSAEINESLKGYGPSLSRVFDFRRLLIKAPSGLLIEPPIVSEMQNTLVISQGGIEAAVADKIYNIGEDAKIVTAPRDWRQYLTPLPTSEITPPPKILWPVNSDEKKAWDNEFQKGWNAGVKQADQIFGKNLELLTSDFNGMIRYKILLAQKMISAPYALHEDRGITGGGNELRVGDRAIRITGPSQFRTGFEEWQPADR